MEANQLSAEEIKKRLDDYFATGYNIKDYCFFNDDITEADLEAWIRQYYPEKIQPVDEDDAGFMTVNIVDSIVERKKPGPKKQIPVATPTQTLFAKIGDIELYQHVSASYLKSLKS